MHSPNSKFDRVADYNQQKYKTARTKPSRTFNARNAVELAAVERNNFLESIHTGSAVVYSPDGTTPIVLGDIKALIFARSALKPFQAIGSMQAGASLKGDKVAIAAGSHTGDFKHLQTVHSMLIDAGLIETDLQCPAVYSKDKKTRQWMIQNKKNPSPLAMGCSGKHAAFLTACVKNNWSIKNYLDFEHPVQQQTFKAIEEFTNDKISQIGIDGCGAPVAAISLLGLARGYSRLSRAVGNLSENARAVTVATAMVDYPEMIQGPGFPDTVTTENLGIICKHGAEGIMAMATANGTSVAVKILDGSIRATHLVGLILLAIAGAIDVKAVLDVIEKTTKPIMGGKEEVGRIHAGEAIRHLIEADPILLSELSEWI